MDGRCRGEGQRVGAEFERPGERSSDGKQNRQTRGSDVPGDSMKHPWDSMLTLSWRSQSKTCRRGSAGEVHLETPSHRIHRPRRRRRNPRG
eukprot:scaffold587_cov339-Pavlova_lutheri.AAC.37